MDLLAKSDFYTYKSFSLMYCCYLHKENFANIALFILIREFETSTQRQ